MDGNAIQWMAVDREQRCLTIRRVRCVRSFRADSFVGRNGNPSRAPGVLAPSRSRKMSGPTTVMSRKGACARALCPFVAASCCRELPPRYVSNTFVRLDKCASNSISVASPLRSATLPPPLSLSLSLRHTAGRRGNVPAGEFFRKYVNCESSLSLASTFLPSRNPRRFTRFTAAAHPE